MSDILEICQLAVDTCFWPLFEVIDGEWILNYEPKKKLPIEDFLRPQGRFKHLFKPGKEHLIADIQAEVDRRWDELFETGKIRICRGDKKCKLVTQTMTLEHRQVLLLGPHSV